jgi:hypothetical protein
MEAAPMARSVTSWRNRLRHSGPQVGHHHRFELREGPLIHVFVEVLEGVDDLLGDDVGPGGEHLADLDVQRTELLQGAAQGHGPHLLVDLGVDFPVAAPAPAQPGLVPQKLAENPRHLHHPLALLHQV